MDAVSISASSLRARTDQTHQTVSMAMMKNVAEQQQKMANILADSVLQSVPSQPSSDSRFGFSTYA